MTHVTVVPALTVRGSKVKSFMRDWVASAAYTVDESHPVVNPSTARPSTLKVSFKCLRFMCLSIRPAPNH